MAVLDVVRVPSPRSGSAARPGAPARVRPATARDADRTAALELLGAGLATRLFPALVRRRHRLAVRRPGSVALVAERTGPGGRRELAGFLVGTRRGVVDLLVTDDGPAPEATARALLAEYRARCAAHGPAGRGARARAAA